MPRIAAVLLVVLALLAIGSQLLLPPFLAGKVEDRLTERGGSAEVELSAFPAVRLLFDDGDAFRVEGKGIDLELDRSNDVLERLDGFGEVEVALEDSVAGPLRVSRFELSRASGDPDYITRIGGRTSPRDAASFLGGRTAGPLGGLFGDLAAGALPDGGETEVPLELEAQVLSRDGRASVVSATGSVAGVPAGPLTEVVVDAVLAAL